MPQEEFLKAKNYALRLIAIRPRSEKEIKQKLSYYLHKKYLPENLAGQIIAHLKEFNFINDLEFTKWWFDQRRSASIRGNKIIEYELKLKGISPDIIKELLATFSEEEELEKAKKVIAKFLRIKSAKVSNQILKMKLENLLFRRGFTSSIIKKAIDDCL
ncbi:hypothetical protein A2W14_02330 [Candidatus Gottesmanbacteria bacterium RBG_16_37_8]|uniref:Regulatory protein RecX n=1 Tax=Candidatus Gottesmanbacteria bacterium RBG_16_37_8 TaxID=1798371 RepID=A0A1F5YR97_9BACT|nr:MAG: hypothetical protein A2W14_02330 [Candidatus Gottesmanbacteria bacterium RBG_16_37_8]